MTAATTAGELVAAKTICLVLKIGRFGNHKRAPLTGAVLAGDSRETHEDGSMTVTVDDPTQEPDKALLRLTKTLLDSPELVAISKHDSGLAGKIRGMAFSSLFKGGVYLIPIAMVESIESILQNATIVRQALVDKAVHTYQTRVDETQARLGVAGNAADYPSAERFRASFYMEYSYVTFDTPSRLKAISAALFKNEAEKARKRLESVAEECQQVMRAGLMDLVDHLADRLTPGADGKAKRLSNSTIGNLNDFLATFELRDVTDDSQLGDIVVKARAVMAGLDHKALKSDDLIRLKVVQELAGLKAALDPLVVDKATRIITFEEDEA